MEQLMQAILKGHVVYLLQLGVGLIASAGLYVTGHVFYNIFLHPLRSFPGPLIPGATNLWRHKKVIGGRLPQAVKELHDQYGPVVRIAPGEISFIEAEAWKDIYGHHSSYEMKKSDKFYRILGDRSPDSILTANRAKHSMLRRQMAHGFSERSMRGQEPIFREYVDLLMRRLSENTDGGRKALDMRSWFNFTTFDMIGNLGFGSDFGCLESSEYHPWIQAIVGSLKENAVLRLLAQYIPQFCVVLLADKMKERSKALGFAKDRMRARMNVQTERLDLIEGLLKKHEGDALSLKDLEMNAALLITAGSETTATLLSGAVFLLGQNPAVLSKLTHEVRSSFTSEDQITLLSVNKLDYMLACLNESLRQYPPVAVGLPRVVPKGGCKVAGRWIPQDTIVSVWQWAANYNEKNFTRPNEFHPERFLGDERFANDDLSAMQPFSIGPRNCIGRNLAYAEMRLILARILFKFDIELAPGSEGWIKGQNIYTLWDKPELPVYLKPVESTA